MTGDGARSEGAGRRRNISRWSIEHPYIIIAFYLGVALDGRTVYLRDMAEVLNTARERRSLYRLFPWSDTAPSGDRASLDFRAGGTIGVRALPGGDSPVGCRQMIGMSSS